MVRIIVERAHDGWSAWVEGRVETGFNGRTPAHAVNRLVDALGLDVQKIAPATEPSPSGRMVFVYGESCGDCGGSGRYVGLLQSDACETCGGTGRLGGTPC